MGKPEHNKNLTVPKPGKIEFVNRPYPRVKPGSVLVKTEIAALCVDDWMYTDHIHEGSITRSMVSGTRVWGPSLKHRSRVCSGRETRC